MIDLHYSLSDRIRYYWHEARISAAIDKLVANLSGVAIPLGMLSQYFPLQFPRLMAGVCAGDPHSLIIDKIQEVLRAYAYGGNERQDEAVNVL
ncbi:Tagatose-bisphosphate aldolase [Serratia silvae]